MEEWKQLEFDFEWAEAYNKWDEIVELELLMGE